MARNCEPSERGVLFLVWDARHSHKAGPTEGDASLLDDSDHVGQLPETLRGPFGPATF